MTTQKTDPLNDLTIDELRNVDRFIQLFKSFCDQYPIDDEPTPDDLPIDKQVLSILMKPLDQLTALLEAKVKADETAKPNK